MRASKKDMLMNVLKLCITDNSYEPICLSSNDILLMYTFMRENNYKSEMVLTLMDKLCQTNLVKN